MKKHVYMSVALLVAGLTANASNIVPYEETFESYVAGFEMPGTNGWSAAASSDAVVSTNAASIGALNAYSELCGYPVGTASHDKVLEITGMLTNSFSMDADQVVWVDMMLEAGRFDGIHPATLVGVQAATFFNSAGHPMVYQYDSGSSSNFWAEIPEVTKSGWVRATIGLNYQTDHFQLKMDGNLLTSTFANTASDGSGSSGGSWFAMPTAADQLNMVLLDATDSVDVDDLVVTTADPFLPKLQSLEHFSGDVFKLVVDFPVGNQLVAPGSFHPVKTASLVSPSWAQTQHSTNGIDGWMLANLDYSATEGSSRVIYLESADATAFFRVEE